MRRAAKIIAVVAAVLLALVIAFLLNFDWLLRKGVTALLQDRTGCPVEIQRLELGLRDGTLLVEGLTIGNPPGFGDAPLLSLPELYLAYDLAAAATNSLRFREVRVNFDQLSMVIDAQGRTNLTEIMASLEKAGLGQQAAPKTNLLGGMTFGGIDQLRLSLGRVSYQDLRRPADNMNIIMGITNRTLTNVVSVTNVAPLALEVLIKTAIQLGMRR